MGSLEVFLQASPDGPKYSLDELGSLPDHLYAVVIKNMETGCSSETLPHPKRIIAREVCRIKKIVSEVSQQRDKCGKTQGLPPVLIETYHASGQKDAFAKIKIEGVLSNYPCRY